MSRARKPQPAVVAVERWTPMDGDRLVERNGTTIEGHGPGIACHTCGRSSVLAGVWFWGLDNNGTTKSSASDVAMWCCPPCFTRSSSWGRSMPYQGRAA